MYYLIIRPISEDSAEVESYLDRLKDITGVDPYTLKQKFQGSALNFLMHHAEREILEDIAGELSKEGIKAIVVSLKQRFDELPKLVTVCERYMKHEAETLEKVIKARSVAAEAKTVKESGEADGMITEALKSLFAVSENYPELKADKRFGQLQTRISELENEISDRRELYNESVNIHNIRIAKIPDAFIAGSFGYRSLELWKIESAHRKDPGVSFSN